MPFPKGKSGNPKGKKPGTPNKFTKQFKELLTETFHQLESEKGKGLLEWGKKNEGDFYKICARLIPTELTGEGGGDITIRIVRD